MTEHDKYLEVHDRRRQLWLDEIRTQVDPVRNKAADLERARLAMVITGFRASYTLNGGAAIAAPTLWQIFQTSNSSNEVFQSLLFFVLGLICTVISNFTAHYSADALCGARQKDAAALQAEITQRLFEDYDAKDFVAKQRRAEHMLDILGQVLHITTALLLAASAVLFAVGVFTFYS